MVSGEFRIADALGIEPEPEMRDAHARWQKPPNADE